MKTLQESLFDSDLVQKEVRGHRLEDVVFFDGQRVQRLSKYDQEITGMHNPHVLEVIDWKKVRADLKKFDGNNINLGLYGYYNADNQWIRTTDVVKKTELLAKLILCIPCVEECNFKSYNSRFRDELEKKLDEYILPRWKGKNGYYFEINDHGLLIDLTVVLYWDTYSNMSHGLLQLDFVRK